MVSADEAIAVPGDDLEIDFTIVVGLDPVEALKLVVAKPDRDGGAGLDDEGAAGIVDHLPGRFGIGAMEMTGERDMNSGLAHRLDRILVPTDRFGQLAALADRHREQGMVSDEDPGLVLGHVGEARPDQRHLLLVDPAVLDRQRARRVDSEHGEPVILEPRAQIGRDIPLVARQGPGEAAEKIVERDIVIARHGDDLEPVRAEPVEPGRGEPELGDPRALSEIAADDEKVRAMLEKPGLGGVGDLRLMGAEMDVGKVGNGRHGG